MRYPPVGQCIYCGIVDVPPGMKRFHDEHIVPLALNGALILPEASCQQCERIINREIENRLLTEEYARFRAKYGLPTRRPRNRKKTVKLPSITGDWIKVPATEYTAPVPLYRFKMARILSGVPPIPNSHAWTMDILGGGDEEVRLQKKYPLWTKAHTFRPRPYQFARFIAKVAYGFAVANLGIDCFEPLANDTILGRSDDYFRFVGSEPREPPPSGWPDGGQHHFSIVIRFVRDNVGLVVVDVKFFADAGTPVYHAVVGEIDLGKPAYFAAWERHRSKDRWQPMIAEPFGLETIRSQRR